MLDDLDTAPVDSEQRANPRRDVSIRCRVLACDIERFTRIVDLSCGGARVVTATPPGVGTRLGLRFALRPGGAEVEATAIVIWRVDGFRGRGGLMGVEFQAVSNPSEIADFVRRA